MQALSEFFIKNYKFTLVLTIGVVIMGFMGLKRMNVESFPAVEMGVATIVTSYDGATAEDIETKITKPIEDEIRGVTGLKDTRSISQAGLSTIIVRVDIDDPKVIVKDTMDEIQKAVDRANDLPADLVDPPKFTEMKSEEFPVIEIAVEGVNTNRKRDLISDLLKEELEDDKRIKEVRLVGYAERAFQIELDLKKMQIQHISMDEVLRKINSRNTNTPGGAVREPETQRLVRVEGKIKNKKELDNVVIRSNFSGQTVLLKDIAEVKDDEEEITTLARHNGNEATLLVVTKKAGADTIAMVDEVDKKLEYFRSEYPEYAFKIYNNESLKVKNRVDVLFSNAISGLLLVILFLFIFLPGKIGLVASMSLPIAIFGTLGLMPYYGMNIDTITILALVIALGMLVDNSVVISENFTRLRREGMDPMEAARTSIAQLWLPITATAFTTIAAFMPMLVTKGVMGKFIKWIPIVVSLSLVLSLFESFFFLPMRLKLAGGNVKAVRDDGKSDWFSHFEARFEKFMSFIVQKRYWITLAFSGIIVFSFYMMGFANKFILFPPDQTEMYVARVEMKKGYRLKSSDQTIEKISQDIKTLLGDQVTHLVARAGVARMDMNDPKGKEGNNVGMISIYVNDYAKFNIPHTEMIEKLRTITPPQEVTSLAFEARVNGPPVGNDIEATFRSNDKSKLYGLINKISAELSKINGVSDLRIDDVIGDDEIFVNIDYQKADRLGLDINNIGSTVRAAISGRRISTVTLNNKDVDLIVRFKEGQRKNLDDLGSISILDGRGNLVPLNSFATFSINEGSPQIKRFDFKRSKTLTGDVNEDITTPVVVNAKLSDLYNQYRSEFPGVSLVFGGAAESTKESMDSLYQALVLSLIGIFALLVFLFKSFIRPMIIMTTIPLGLLGFSVAFFFHGRPISFMALIGIIGLGGIIVNSGIVLISFIDQMREEGKLSFNQILARASGLRLRAVMVTSLTTISGLIPTAYGIGGSDAILIPMTLAMAWGLTSGTILTLVWVPCAYAILEDVSSLTERIFLKSKNSINLKEKSHVS
jgi:multidrug efflux pump subunit AcrB